MTTEVLTKSHWELFEEFETLNNTHERRSLFFENFVRPKKKMQFLKREERGEKIFIHLLQRKDKKQKKKKSLHISHAQIYPLPGILQKKMAFALQINAAAATKKKTAAPKKTTVKKVRSCLFRAGLFPTGFRFFFSSLSPKMVLSSSKGGEKTRPKNEPKKRNIRIFASMRIRPQKPPFRRRQTRASNAEMYREYIGARFDAAASVARRSRGGPFFRRLCVRKTKVERDLQSFFHRRSIYRTKTNVRRWEKNDEGEILFLVRF